MYRSYWYLVDVHRLRRAPTLGASSLGALAAQCRATPAESAQRFACFFVAFFFPSLL
jgi:hypothetical protein